MALTRPPIAGRLTQLAGAAQIRLGNRPGGAIYRIYMPSGPHVIQRRNSQSTVQGEPMSKPTPRAYPISAYAIDSLWPNSNRQRPVRQPKLRVGLQPSTGPG